MDFWLFLFLCFCSFTVRQYGLLTFKIHRVLVVVITAKIHRACAQYLADHADALLDHASCTLVDDAVIDHLIFDDDWRGKSAAFLGGGEGVLFGGDFGFAKTCGLKSGVSTSDDG